MRTCAQASVVAWLASFHPGADSSKGGFVNQFKKILNSSLAGKIGLASAAMLASVYTVSRVGSETSSLQTAFADVAIAPDTSASQSASSGWDLPNLNNVRVDSWIKLFSTDPQ